MSKVYLRLVESPQGKVLHTTLEIFEGDIVEDRKYFEKHQGATSVRYFKLREVK